MPQSLPPSVMVMDGVTVLGLLAGTLTTAAFVPQLLKTWRTKSAADVSLGLLVTFCIGVLLWLVYGILLGAWPIILANLVTLALAGCILALKIRFGEQRGEERAPTTATEQKR